MLPTFRSGIEMLTVAAMVNANTPSPSTDKETRDESNHANTPSPIQTANSPNSSPNNWKITQADPLTQHLNTASSQEDNDNDPNFVGLYLLYDAAMQHDNCSDNAHQVSSDTNKADAPTTDDLNKASAIVSGENRLPFNSTESNSTEPKTYICEFITNTKMYKICGKKFLGKAQMNHHLRNHTNKPHHCKLCEKTFEYSSGLKRHEKVHSNDKPFSCDFCNTEFREKHHLERHIRTHTGDKPFPCTLCPNRFADRSNFNQHMRVYHSGQDFTCTFCGIKFNARYYLQRHIRAHSKERSFFCGICNKEFTRKANLVAHRSIHTGDKPDIYCTICKKTFSTTSNLSRHMRNIHPTIPANL